MNGRYDKVKYGRTKVCGTENFAVLKYAESAQLKKNIPNYLFIEILYLSFLIELYLLKEGNKY